jgi:hypothetical protein
MAIPADPAELESVPLDGLSACWERESWEEADDRATLNSTIDRITFST